MTPTERATLERYFQTLNAWDEDAHIALFDPRATYTESVSGIQGMGLGTLRGIFRGAREAMHVRRIVPLEVREEGAYVVVQADIFGGSAGIECRTEGTWRLSFTPEGRIRSLAIDWKPGPLQPLWSDKDTPRRP